MKGNIVIISSPSGGGKGTLIRAVLEMVPDLGYSVSLTTRLPRKGEIEGIDYQFVTKEEFQAYADAGRFLEYAEVHGNLYGTSLEQINRIIADGRDVILEIDVQGADAVLEKVPEAVSIFILPPSFEELKARLVRRATEDSSDLELRLRNSFVEVQQYTHFKYLVINDEVAAASQRIASIILGERQRRDRQTKVIRSILDSFDPLKL